jgi:predicted O-methyltransferase YrrM
MSEYQFTKDWFQWAPQVWEQLIPLLPERAEEGRCFLEIGSFEGRSMVWIAENMMQDGDSIDCVDTWEGGEEHGEENMSEVEKRFKHNAQLVMDKYPSGQGGTMRPVFAQKGPSVQALGWWLYEDLKEGKPNYDFIYIDGSHIAKDVLTDACMAWPLLKPKGLMVFDDYMWGNPRDILHRPKPAIDAFCNLFAEEAEIVHVGYQLVVRKKGE